MVRFPALYRSVAVVVSRFGLASGLRRALLRRALVSGWAAFNRRDLELMLVRYGPEVEFQFYAGFQTLGLDGTYRGREQMRDSLQELTEDWEAIELEPAYVVDLTDTVLNLGFMRARGRASGARVEMEMRNCSPSETVSWQATDRGTRGTKACGPPV